MAISNDKHHTYSQLSQTPVLTGSVLF